jgi:hypothetical protein
MMWRQIQETIQRRSINGNLKRISQSVYHFIPPLVRLATYCLD